MILSRIWWFGFGGWFVNLSIIFCVLLECKLKFTAMNGKTVYQKREKKFSMLENL